MSCNEAVIPKLAPDPKSVAGPLYVKTACVPSALRLAEKLEGANPAAVMVPRFTREPPAMFIVNVNLSPGWICCVELGLALRTVS
jgi:hypothetical protein